MRRPLAAAALLIALAGCRGGGSSSPPSTSKAPSTPVPSSSTTLVTVATTPIPGGSGVVTSTATTTAGAVATPPPDQSGTAVVPTTTIPLQPTSAGTTATSQTPTTGARPAACDARTLASAAVDRFDLPAGSAASDARCVQNWASALITVPGQGNVFAVFELIQGKWDGANLGTDAVCSDAGVPTDLFGPLNCAPWEG
jgi:hypothetical protein